MTPDTTVYDYAMEWAIGHGWSFQQSDTVAKGLIGIDTHRQIVAVHPDSAKVTLRMNTAGGGIFQNYPAKS
jgi:hypothetical protein